MVAGPTAAYATMSLKMPRLFMGYYQMAGRYVIESGKVVYKEAV